ncbi:Membrane-bound lytic murein transglycosylase F [Firmicutes bacterium ASF500]|nr:Membrane-bound lytic murein transglycosylase F [Firmicutes bacterium ASF500]
MSLSFDLKILELQGAGGTAPRRTAGSSGDMSFAQVLAGVSQSGGGNDFETYFQAASEAYGVPVNLLKAVAKAESAFDPTAVSHCGAQGVMQLMPATARAMGVTDAFDPAQNIMGGAKYLSQMLDTFDGDVSLAVAAYNAGPGAVKKHGGIPYESTRNYVNKVLDYAGGEISIDRTAGSSALPSLNGALSQEDVAGLLLQINQTGGVTSSGNPEYVRMLLHQMFLDGARDYEEDQGLGV